MIMIGLMVFAGSDVSGDKATFSDITLSAPELASEGMPASPSDEELAEIFGFMDADGDGTADLNADDIAFVVEVPHLSATVRL